MFAISRILGRRVLFFAGLIAVSSWAAAQSSLFTPIDAPNAGTRTHQGTAATAIDAAGDVAGIYVDKSSIEHAFVLPAGGTITPFDASGTGGSKIETIPIGFDTAGNIVGLYHDANGQAHGFVRAASSGTVTIFDVTGESTGNLQGTFPDCMNGSGVIAGGYSSTITTPNGNYSVVHGFVRNAGGAITSFDPVPIPSSWGKTTPGTYVVSINASGTVAGFYIDSTSTVHGFLRDAGGNITTFQALDPATGSGQITVVTGIDAAGDVIGAYPDTNNMIHGFVRNASTGKITTIDAPGAGTAPSQGTYPDAFDAAGDISGSFTDANSVVHGFVLPANGTITVYDAPGSGSTDVKGVGARLSRKLKQPGQSYGSSTTFRRPNSPLAKLTSLLSKVGAVKAEGSGLLNGNGLNPSGTASPGNLILNGVNASGEILGLVTDGDLVFHGYLRAANGAITTLDAPDAGTAVDQGTGGLAINDSGMIAGTYADANSILHGFIFDSSTLTPTTTKLTPVPTPNPSVYGEPVTLSATVHSTAGSPPNGENVTFLNGPTTLGTGSLASGAASMTTTNLPTNTDSITAVYAGDASFGGSSSTAVSQVVNKAGSTTTLTSSPNASAFGQSVTLTATVSGQFGGTATGSVTFSYGSPNNVGSATNLGSANLSGNSASLTTTALPQGTDSVVALYNGDGNFNVSVSDVLFQVVNSSGGPLPPAPAIGGISPSFTSAGGAAFPLTVTGGGFVNNSTVHWGTSSLTTTYVSATLLTAQVPAADIATAGTTGAITVVTPSPGGGTSSILQFQVDSASGSTTGPTFSSITETVNPGSTAGYPVTLPSSVQSASVSCLNLPTGATCSYSSTSNAVTIATSSTTPAGIYQITVVFTETVTGAASSWILLPILLLPLFFLRRRLAARGVWVSACFGLVLLASTLVVCVGCGGSSSGQVQVSTPQTHQVTSSGAVTLIVQ